jgi:hypothetical protein
LFQAPYTGIRFTVSPCPSRGRVEKNFKRKGPMGFYTTMNSGILWRYNRQMCMASNYNGLEPMGSFEIYGNRIKTPKSPSTPSTTSSLYGLIDIAEKIISSSNEDKEIVSPGVVPGYIVFPSHKNNVNIFR